MERDRAESDTHEPTDHVSEKAKNNVGIRKKTAADLCAYPRENWRHPY